VSGDLYTEPRLASAALITIDTQCDVLDGAPLRGIGVVLMDASEIAAGLTPAGARAA
jgi:hypothetical protein